MKREILFLFCVLSAIMSKAENYGNYIPFLVEGKSWVVTYVQDNTNSYKRTYTIKGDTIINNMKYKKLFEEERGIYLYALREEGEKIYSIWPYGNPKAEESLWYDFGVNEGDMIETERSRLYITGTDHISINGIKRKRIHIYATYNEDHEKYNGNGVWVEGIGSDLGPIRPDSWGRDGSKSTMDECSNLGQILFEYSDFSAPRWEVEETGIESQYLVRTQSSVHTYDLQGRRLTRQPQCGVYIRDGKKVVVK